MNTIEIRPSGPLHATIRPPGSKSITNRALVCAALADGPCTLRGALDSEDTRMMIGALRQLGVDVITDRHAATITVSGCAGWLPSGDAELHVGNSGTTIRFLTAMVTLGRGIYRLDGIERMRQRPIGDLLNALSALGASAVSENDNKCPPVVVRAAGLPGGRATVRGDISSQFLSGLLMTTPYADSDVHLAVEGELVSQPYVHMTLAVMRAFDVDVPAEDLSRFDVSAPQRYRACTYNVEPDASAASYFWAAAAITGGRVTVEGLTRDALQGDVAFCDCLGQMGCEVIEGENAITVVGKPLSGIDVDMNAISDTVQTLAAVALFADSPTTIHGVAHIRHKETDRIGDLARELRKFGADVEELPDGLKIEPRSIAGARIETYNDHRMAMSLALVGLRTAGVEIENPDCTKKTYPEFWKDLQSLEEKCD